MNFLIHPTTPNLSLIILTFSFLSLFFFQKIVAIILCYICPLFFENPLQRKRSLRKRKVLQHYLLSVYDWLSVWLYGCQEAVIYWVHSLFDGSLSPFLNRWKMKFLQKKRKLFFFLNGWDNEEHGDGWNEGKKEAKPESQEVAFFLKWRFTRNRWPYIKSSASGVHTRWLTYCVYYTTIISPFLTCNKERNKTRIITRKENNFTFFVRPSKGLDESWSTVLSYLSEMCQDKISRSLVSVIMNHFHHSGTPVDSFHFCVCKRVGEIKFIHFDLFVCILNEFSFV